MNHSIFQVISEAFAGTTNKVSFEIAGQGNGSIKAVVMAKLGAVAANASPEEKALHAAICTPLVAMGTPAEVEQAMLDRIKEYANTVQVGTSALAQVRDLAKNAVAAAEKKHVKATPAATAKAVEPDDDEGDGSSGQEEVTTAVTLTPAHSAPQKLTLDNF